MLSARTIYGEIFDNDEAFRLFCSIAASGEAQGGWENGRIAALVPGSQAGLAPKIARHGADVDKHGRIFTALLRKRGLGPVAVPPDADYTMRLEAAGIAALGAMQAGMVHALYERGIAPDLLIGTSAGALNAAFLASRPATTAAAQELAAIWRGLRRSDILPLRPATFVSGLAGRRDHLIPDRALRRLAARHLQSERLEHTAIPLHLVAFDLLAATEVRLSDGPLADAVLAAAAIPGVLPPVRWRGRLLADGGIADNTPVSHAVALGAQRIYVLPTQNPGDRGLSRPPRGALAAAVYAITVLTNARLHDDLARYALSAELIVLPAANPGHIPPTDFGHADQLITRALTAARTALAAATPSPPQEPALVQQPPAPQSPT